MLERERKEKERGTEEEKKKKWQPKHNITAPVLEYISVYESIATGLHRAFGVA